ncbi:LOW QUALITY PROTEIN: stage V sporulation protein AD [Bacillus sp. JCM 19047]|nr:LOW QUALITY PROTEIN: stage V sporulation protein AD [Bacillus sp. JCM 19047]
MLVGKQSWRFDNQPVIISTGTVGGPFEGNGAIPEAFDLLHDELWIGEKSFEKAQTILVEGAVTTALKKASVKKEDVNFLLAGDLVNQLTHSSFAGRSLAIPYLGMFGACSTSMEGLALGSFLINGSGAHHVVSVASSHNSATEKQFRYPTEYGGQKPPTAQWTATAAGAALVAKTGDGPRVTGATMGKVIDMGISDPFNMGGAMAPAAADTIETHFKEFHRGPDDYDLIVTGDLGQIGLPICRDLLKQKGYELGHDRFQDCGLMLYKEDQPVLAGASGPGCSAVVTYGHLLNKVKSGEIRRLLVVATGALLSPLSFQQKETIPCIAHAVVIESPKGGAL